MTWEDPDPAEVLLLQDPGDWEALQHRYLPNITPRPLERCLEVVRDNGAVCVVIETRYIDLDYRSEFSSFFSKTFAAVPNTAHRLHFFGERIEVALLTRLPSDVCSSYLGYVVIRPSELGRTGRTLLTPPRAMAGGLMQSAVTATIDFFGQSLTVSGVPFAQQDTQFGRCAQVAAWMCHYTAVLRGDVSRRPIADFSNFADPTVAEGRPLPSQGLTVLQLSNLMRDFELPPIVYRMGQLSGSGQERPLPTHDRSDSPGKWDTRAVAVLCRFLNSSYPVLVGTRDHAFVVIGYERCTVGGRPWIRFFRHDDQRGPYLEITNIIDDIDPATQHRYEPWEVLLAAVPEKLWLLPEAAERVGKALIMAYDGLESEGTLNDSWISYRTVAMTSARYKNQAESRGLDADSVREIRLARMSRMVWVVEAVSRQAREEKEASVVGEAVFDSTSSDAAPSVLVLRVPGALLIKQTSGELRSPLPSTRSMVRSASLFQP